MMNGWASILSTIAGAALVFGKSASEGKSGGKKTSTISLDPTEQSYQEYKQKVEESQAQQQANDPRNKTMYLGNPTAPYDPFYDYSDDRIYNTPESVRNLEDKYSANACRARLVSPYLLSEEVKRYIDGTSPFSIDTEKLRELSTIGANPESSIRVKNLGGEPNFFAGYINSELYIPDANIDGTRKYVATSARGNFRYVTFYVEIFNPCDREIELQMCGVSNIKIGGVKCQPVHIGGDLPYGKDFTMGEGEQAAKHYMYDGADYDALNRGNKWWHAARDLQVEPFAGGHSAVCKWKEMSYPYILCDNFFHNGYSNQNWKDVASGMYKFRTGWATEDKENARERNYEPEYLRIPSESSRIVKMTLPLSNFEDTKVYYAPESELIDWDYRKDEVSRIISNLGVPDSEFLNWNIQSLMDLPGNTGHIAVLKHYYETMHKKGIQDYLRFDFVPAPSLNGKVFEIKLQLVNRIVQYYPVGDKDLVNQSDDDYGKSFELKFIPGSRPADMTKEWRYSYIDDRNIPDENQSRSTQLGLIQKKFNYAYEDTINEAFDASANN